MKILLTMAKRFLAAWRCCLSRVLLILDALRSALLHQATRGGPRTLVTMLATDHSQDSLLVHFVHFSRALIQVSPSQMLQDCFAEFVASNVEINRTFVEAGACDGVTGSNTLMLEQYFGWEGLLIEPVQAWRIEESGRSAKIDKRCLHSKSGETLALLIPQDLQLSTLNIYKDRDIHKWERDASGVTFETTTISLNDALAQHALSTKLGYLSLDTEGSEFEILSTFDIDFWRPSIITVEHNHSRFAAEIDRFLVLRDYRQVLRGATGHESWYLTAQVHDRLLAAIAERQVCSAPHRI